MFVVPPYLLHSVDDLVQTLTLHDPNYGKKEWNIEGGADSLIRQEFDYRVLDIDTLLVFHSSHIVLSFLAIRRLRCRHGFVTWEHGFQPVLPYTVDWGIEDGIGDEVEDCGEVDVQANLCTIIRYYSVRPSCLTNILLVGVDDLGEYVGEQTQRSGLHDNI